MPMDSFAFHGTAAVQVMPLVEPPPSGEQRRKSAAPWRDPVRLSQSQLDRFIRHHEAFLGRRPGGKRLMLRHAVLEGLTLAGHDLSEADLGGAQMSGCDLRQTKLAQADLYCADLTDVEATGADFSRADMRGVSLRGARLNNTRLDGADLRAAVLAAINEAGGIARLGRERRTETEGGLIGEVGEAVENSADLSDASLICAQMEGAFLKHADFSGAVLAGARLNGARRDGVRLNGAVLTGLNVGRLGLTSRQLEGGLFDPGPAALNRAPVLMHRLERAEAWWRSGGAEGEPAVFDGEDLRVVNGAFSGKSLTAMSAKRTLAVGLDFSGALLQGAQFDGADLRCANFEGADLRGASFAGCNLAHARFKGADIGELQVSETMRRAANFDEAHKPDLAEAVFGEAAKRAF